MSTIGAPSSRIRPKLAAYFEVSVEVLFSITPFPRIGGSRDSA